MAFLPLESDGGSRIAGSWLNKDHRVTLEEVLCMSVHDVINTLCLKKNKTPTLAHNFPKC